MSDELRVTSYGLGVRGYELRVVGYQRTRTEPTECRSDIFDAPIVPGDCRRDICDILNVCGGYWVLDTGYWMLDASINYPLSIINYPLSTIPYSLLTINFHLSPFHFQLITVPTASPPSYCCQK